VNVELHRSSALVSLDAADMANDVLPYRLTRTQCSRYEPLKSVSKVCKLPKAGWYVSRLKHTMLTTRRRVGFGQ